MTGTNPKPPMTVKTGNSMIVLKILCTLAARTKAWDLNQVAIQKAALQILTVDLRTVRTGNVSAQLMEVSTACQTLTILLLSPRRGRIAKMEFGRIRCIQNVTFKSKALMT
jgi:hypothetical protein